MRPHDAQHRLLGKHTRLVLTRLYREISTTSFKSIAFQTLCTAVGTPYNLRPVLLAALVNAGYVTREAEDQLRLTSAGEQLVTTRFLVGPRSGNALSWPFTPSGTIF